MMKAMPMWLFHCLIATRQSKIHVIYYLQAKYLMIIYLSEYTKNNKDNILHYKNTVLYTILHIWADEWISIRADLSYTNVGCIFQMTFAHKVARFVVSSYLLRLDKNFKNSNRGKKSRQKAMSMTS